MVGERLTSGVLGEEKAGAVASDGGASEKEQAAYVKRGHMIR